MSGLSHNEALAIARKMLRGFTGAPDPRRHAQQLYSELVHASGWSEAQEAQIIALGAWLHTRPPMDSLKPRCATLIEKLA